LVPVDSYSDYNGFSRDGITSSIIRIRNTKNVNYGSYINLESFTIYNNGALRGDLTIRRSLIKATDPTDNFLSYKTTTGNTNHPTNDLIITDGSSVLVDFDNARKNIYISELSKNSNIIRSGTGGSGLFVYTEDGARLTNCRLENIKNIECMGQFSEFSNVEFLNTQLGMLNWQAGRIDRFKINVPSTTSGWYSWIGAGGNNSFWDWNPISIDKTKIVHQNNSAKYYSGYTASLKFVDKFSNIPIENVLIRFKDNRNNPSGVTSFRAQYITNSVGVMTGTTNSQDLTNTANGEKPTLFILTHKSRQTGGSTSTGVSDPSSSNNYVIDNVSTELEVRSYLHKYVPENFSISSEMGEIDQQKNVIAYSNFYLTEDDNITEKNINTVLAYSKIDSTTQLYDRLKAMWRNNNNYPKVTVEGTTIRIPDNWDLILDKSLSQAISIDVGNKIIRVKTESLEPTEKIDKLISPNGTVTFASDEYINLPFTDETSNSYVKIVNVDPTDYIRVFDGNTLKFERYGSYGFPYNSANKNFKIELEKANGTKAMKLYDLNRTGIDNVFYISFIHAVNNFNLEDRTVLYQTPELTKDKLENNKRMLNNIKSWMIMLTKKIQNTN
jgi:hypothetical protein